MLFLPVWHSIGMYRQCAEFRNQALAHTRDARGWFPLCFACRLQKDLISYGDHGISSVTECYWKHTNMAPLSNSTLPNAYFSFTVPIGECVLYIGTGVWKITLSFCSHKVDFSSSLNRLIFKYPFVFPLKIISFFRTKTKLRKCIIVLIGSKKFYIIFKLFQLNYVYTIISIENAYGFTLQTKIIHFSCTHFVAEIQCMGPRKCKKHVILSRIS